jgi:hypothetical protein
MFGHRILITLLLLSLVPGAIREVGAASATLTVGTEPRQTFKGFGFSFEQGTPYADLSDEHRALVDQLLFRDLNTTVIRLWYGPGEPEPLRDDFLAAGVIDGALRNGVEEILLAPWDYLGNPEAHARQIAEDVRIIREDYGIPITATGLINEPSSKDWKILPPEHFIPLQVAIRRELDARGLSDVTILSPEWASADRAARGWFDVVETSPEAMASFDAFATHSYNMAAAPDLADRVLKHNKDYWVTEAGGPKRDGSAEFAYDFAATASSRFLNDLNNGVTHWIWFIGLSHTSRDVYQKLVMCEGECASTNRIYENYTYHHIKQVTSAFKPGTEMRHVTSDLPRFPDLHYTYGPKPPLQAAAGVAPDGRWVVAVVNDTVGGSRRIASWEDPKTYVVTIEVPELEDVPGLAFDLCRTNAEVRMDCDSIDLVAGRATLEIVSSELITLIAQPSTE